MSKIHEDVTVGTNPGATVTSDVAYFYPKAGTQMYSTMVKNFAKKSGKSLEHVDNLWNHHVKQTKKKYKEDHPKFYPAVVRSLKKDLGIDENSIGLKVDKMLQDSSNVDFIDS